MRESKNLKTWPDWTNVRRSEGAALPGRPYLVTPHEAQVTQRLAALRDLSGSLVCDVLTPAGVHGLDGAAVLAYGYQSCGHMGGGGKRRGRRVSLVTFLI